MTAPLSPYRLGKAREVFNLYNVFNSLSWNFLVGSVITLFALRLGASSTYIGTLNALLYVAFFFLPLGKSFARRFKIVSIFSFAWIARALGMIPVVLAPIAAYMGHYDRALNLTLLGVAIFHVTRGVGMIANNPVLSFLSSGPDRGSYMTQIQIINSATGMFAGFAIALVLSQEQPSLFLYSIISTVGIICGITSGVLIKKIPEPPVEEASEKVSLAGIFRDAFSEPAIRRFAGILLMVALVSGVSRTFLVVYAREALSQTDGLVSLYSVFGGLGNLVVGMLIKFLVDRIGAKPIFIICVIIGLVTMLLIIIFPSSAIGNLTTVFLFLAFLFFMLNFGFLGSEGIAQTYFMGLIPPAKMLDMGIVYFFIFGVAGAGGSMLAGLLLDLFSVLGFSSIISFKLLFALLIVITIIIITLQRKLTSLGALSLAGAVKIIFSYRDLQAITLLDRLDKAQDSRQEEQLLGALQHKPSQLATKGLLERARSPRLATRLEAISALEQLDIINEDAEKALINDIINNPFTTAYISARILGNHKCVTAIPLLRELAFSSDYMLAGEALIALAKLQDNAFRPHIEEIIQNSDNPRLRIMGAESLGMYRLPGSLFVLIDILFGADPPPYLRDEVTIAISCIVDTQQQFYRLLVRFLSNHDLYATLAMDEAEAVYEFFKTSLGRQRNTRKNNELQLLRQKAEIIQSAISSMVHDNNPEPLSRWIYELPAASFADIPAFEIARVIFPEILMDDEMLTFKRLRLLVIHWTTYQIRNWVKKLKR